MSKTKENLKAAFAGESQARNKYTYFAEVAKKEGYHYIAKFFEETAENEKQHAKDHLRMLNGIGDTLTNLKVNTWKSTSKKTLLNLHLKISFSRIHNKSFVNDTFVNAGL